jgi:hypothetical protein
MDKKILLLLKKYKNDKEGFITAYSENYRRPNPIILNSIDDPEQQISSMLSEELAISIDTNIIAELIWFDKDNFLNGLRLDKLKRILGEE